MSARPLCPICEKRPAKRFCPAKGEKICAICCGQEREVTIDCPLDCPHLIAAHRYEAESAAADKPISANEIPYPDVELSEDFLHDHWPVLAGLVQTVELFHLENKALTDAAASNALAALAETHRTLDTGIYYEKPPDQPLAHALYGRIAQFLADWRKDEAGRAGFSSLKESDIFRLLVFLLRVAKRESSGRPRSRAFLGFLRAQFPPPEQASKEASRIIVP